MAEKHSEFQIDWDGTNAKSIIFHNINNGNNISIAPIGGSNNMAFTLDGGGSIVYSGVVGWIGGNSTNANTAYTHSQDNGSDHADVATATEIHSSKARGYRNAAYNLASSGTFIKIPLDAENYDEQGEFDIAAGAGQGRFTATKAGYYLVHVSIRINGLTTDPAGIGIHKNGAATAVNYQISAGNNNQFYTATDIVYLAATDYVEMYAYQNSGGALAIQAHSNFTFMAVHRLS